MNNSTNIEKFEIVSGRGASDQEKMFDEKKKPETKNLVIKFTWESTVSETKSWVYLDFLLNPSYINELQLANNLIISCNVV